MPPPIVIATVQAAILSAISNVFGQIIGLYKNKEQISIDPIPVFHFIILRFLNAPPQFLWQQFLETEFPSKYQELVDVVPVEENKQNRKRVMGRMRTNWTNTFKKFALDQSFGNFVQAFVYLAIMTSLQSKTTEQAWNTTIEALLPMTKARLQFWPIAALVSFTIVPPSKRVLFNNLVGMTWGIYLSMAQ